MSPRYWLLKSEPSSFSIDDLERLGRSPWDGVRNYQARNHLRDDLKVGDGILFYHSNAKPPAVVGRASVCSAPYPDPSQFLPSSPYYDPAAKLAAPRWFLVDVAFEERFSRPLSLNELRAERALEGMPLLQRGSRLSVQPVADAHFEWIVRAARG